MEYAALVWWTGGCSACRKLKSAQMKTGRRLLGASNTVAGVAVQGNLGWEEAGGKEGRDEVMFGKGLEVLERADWLK